MSIIYCHAHDRRWDSDFRGECPKCEEEDMHGDRDIDAAIDALEKAIWAARNANHAGEVAVLKAAEAMKPVSFADLMRDTRIACLATAFDHAAVKCGTKERAAIYIIAALANDGYRIVKG